MRSKLHEALLPGQIRIATLQPDFFAAPLILTLQITPLDEAPEYESLSYHWGPEDLEWRSIQLNGAAHTITVDLDIALRHLRSLNEPRRLWIDQICIHQANVAEKNTQIPLMRDIFARARRVVMWLGPIQNDAEQAFKSAQHIANALEALNPGGDVDSDRPWYITAVTTDCIKKAITPIRNLMRRQWWSRIWIVQEIAMARERLVLCGFLEIDFKSLSRAHMLVSKMKPVVTRRKIPTNIYRAEPSSSTSSSNEVGAQGNDLSEIFSHLDIASIEASIDDSMDWNPVHVSIAKWEAAGRRVPLLHLVREFRFRNGRDDRDRVFALCGMCPSDYLSTFRIDYEMSVTDVYIQLAKFHLLVHGDLYMLTISQWQPRNRRRPLLPTWVPDWSAPRPRRRSLIRWPLGDAAESDRIDADTIAFEGETADRRTKMESMQWYSAMTNTRSSFELLTSPETSADASPLHLLRIKCLRRSCKVRKTVDAAIDLRPGSAISVLVPTKEKSAASVNRPQQSKQASMHPVHRAGITMFARWLTWEAVALKAGSQHDDDENGEAVPHHQRIYAPTGETRSEAFWRTTLANRTSYGGIVSVEREGSGYSAFKKVALNTVLSAKSNKRMDLETKRVLASQTVYSSNLGQWAMSRKFFVTEEGYMGLAPEGAENGDEVVFVLGLPIPLMLRRTYTGAETAMSGHKDDDRWEVIGECYLHGFMEGEVLQGVDLGNEENFKDFILE